MLATHVPTTADCGTAVEDRSQCSATLSDWDGRAMLYAPQRRLGGSVFPLRWRLPPRRDSGYITPAGGVGKPFGGSAEPAAQPPHGGTSRRQALSLCGRSAQSDTILPPASDENRVWRREIRPNKRHTARATALRTSHIFVHVAGRTRASIRTCRARTLRLLESPRRRRCGS